MVADVFLRAYWRVPQKLDENGWNQCCWQDSVAESCAWKPMDFSAFLHQPCGSACTCCGFFRHFRRLPLGVLSESNRACVERVCAQPAVAADPDLVNGVGTRAHAIEKVPLQPPCFRPQTSEPIGGPVRNTAPRRRQGGQDSSGADRLDHQAKVGDNLRRGSSCSPSSFQRISRRLRPTD